jgi:hypothetical protein
MKRPSVSARDRRALALGSLVAIPALCYGLVIAPYRRAMADLRSHLESQRALLARERALVAEAPALPAALHARESTVLHEAPRLFDGRDLLAASAALATYIGARAYQAHVFVQSSETRAPTPAADGILAVSVDVRADGDLAGIATLLQSIERGPKLVRVERIAIERSGSQAVGTPASDEEILTVEARMTGYALTTLQHAAASPGTER